MSDEDRLIQLEREVRDIDVTLARITVVMETLTEVLPSIHDLDKRVSSNEKNWRIVQWMLGGSGIGLALVLLRLFGLV